MKRLLICPSQRPTVQRLSEILPLAQVPIMGQGLVEYWLTHLAAAGIAEVRLLTADRPECVRALVGDGSRWGLSVEVVPESRELTPAEALIKYDNPRSGVENRITLLDHFPGLPEKVILRSYADWFAAAVAWMPQAITPDRVGVRQLQAGIWVGHNSRVSPEARLNAPCWIGNHVVIGPRTEIGPQAIIEDGSMVEPDSRVTESYIGPDTLVGQCTEVAHSLAWSNTLINWQSGSVVEVSDAFILSALRRPHNARPSFLEQLRELVSGEKQAPGLPLEGSVFEEQGLI